MKTILVLSSSADFGDSLSQGLGGSFKIVARTGVREAEPLIRTALADLVIVDAEADPVQSAWTMQTIRQGSLTCPIIVFLNERDSRGEEEAYARGAAYVLTKPLRVPVLKSIIERALAPVQPGAAPAAMPAPVRPLSPAREIPSLEAARSTNTLQALNAIRDFSLILTHSLNAEGLLKEFLLLVRSVLGVNRAAIFLRENTANRLTPAEPRRLRSASAVGLQHELVNHVDLSYERGIGGYLVQFGRILRRDDPAALADPDVQREFQVLGAQVAVPVIDRETLVGVALFDGRVTGEPLSNMELESIFHLLEGLALAVRNIWLHDQIASDNALLAGVLRELTNGCVVVNADLQIIHANKTARQFFGRAGRRGADLEFSDLPAALGNKMYQVLKTGTAIAPFEFEPPEAPRTVFHINMVPLYRTGAGPTPDSVLLVVEDRTQAQQLRQLEIETANLRLVRTMADRLAHEIGNALVPLSTHQQLLADKYRDPEFRTSLDHALADGVKRIARLTNQMRYLARDAIFSHEKVSLKSLIEEAYEEAQKYHTQKPAKLTYENGTQPLTIAGDRVALKHAMAEVLLNALQANGSDGKIEVSSETVTEPNGSRWVRIAIADAGEGFTPEAAKRVPEPFYTTRNVGLGLGLTVSRKVIEVHEGRLQVEPPKIGHHGLVRIWLPLATDSTAKPK